MNLINRKCKLLIVSILILIVLLTMAIPSFAAKKNVTIKVGFIPIEGFFEYNESNRKVGYGVELLHKISIYSDLDFEFVEVNRSKSIFNALEKGEVDILMPVTDIGLVRDKYKISKNSIIGTQNAIMTLKSRDDLYYDDEETISKMNIGVMKKHYDFDINKENLAACGVSKGNLVIDNNYRDCLEKLEAGKVDAVISNIMDLTDDLKLLKKFDDINNHIISNKDFKYMNEIDMAIENIKKESPTYFTNLFKDYFREVATTPLTKEEVSVLKEREKLEFYFSKDSGSLSRLENGEYVGFLPTLAKKICENLGVEYNIVTNDEEFFGSKASVRTDFYFDKGWAESKDVALSKPYLEFKFNKQCFRYV